MNKNLYSKMLDTGMQAEAQLLPSFQSPFKKAPSRYSIQGQFNTTSKEVLTQLNQSYKILASYLKAYAKFQASKNRGSAAVNFAAFDELFRKAQTFTAEFGNIQNQIRQVVEALGSSINNDSRATAPTPESPATPVPPAPSSPVPPSLKPAETPIPPVGASGKRSLQAEALFGLDFSPEYVQWGDRAIHFLQQQFPQAERAYDQAVAGIEKLNQIITALQPQIAGQPVEAAIGRLQQTLNHIQPMTSPSPETAPEAAPATPVAPATPSAAPSAPGKPELDKLYPLGAKMDHAWLKDYASKQGVDPTSLYYLLRILKGQNIVSLANRSHIIKVSQTSPYQPLVDNVASIYFAADKVGINQTKAYEILKDLVDQNLITFPSIKPEVAPVSEAVPPIDGAPAPASESEEFDPFAPTPSAVLKFDQIVKSNRLGDPSYLTSIRNHYLAMIGKAPATTGLESWTPSSAEIQKFEQLLQTNGFAHREAYPSLIDAWLKQNHKVATKKSTIKLANVKRKAPKSWGL